MKIITIEINILYVNSLLLTTTYYKRPRSAQIRLKLGQFSLKSDQNLSPKRFKKYKTRCRTPLLHLKYEFMVHLTILNKLTNWNELIVLLAKAGWFWTLFLKKWRNDFVKFSEKKKNVYTGILLFLTHLVQDLVKVGVKNLFLSGTAPQDDLNWAVEHSKCQEWYDLMLVETNCHLTGKPCRDSISIWNQPKVIFMSISVNITFITLSYWLFCNLGLVNSQKLQEIKGGHLTGTTNRNPNLYETRV